MAAPHILSDYSAAARPLVEPQLGTPGHNSAEWTQKQQPAEYYRAAAARARALEQDATTPRVKQHLRELIDRYDRLAGEVEKTAERDPGGDPDRLR